MLSATILFLAKMDSAEWGILLGIVATVSLPILASQMNIIIRLSRIENSQVYEREKMDSVRTSQNSLWAANGKHEERIDLHDKFLSKLLDKLKVDVRG